MKRARKFYETILQTQLKEGHAGPVLPASFPYDPAKGVGGSPAKMDGPSPGGGGTTVYPNVQGDLDGVINRSPLAKN
jgi:predicted enzyme related to lactoylglutathione lyase